MTKQNDLSMYTIWIADGEVAKRNGDWDKYNEHCWLAERCANRIGLDAPAWVSMAAANHIAKTTAAA